MKKISLLSSLALMASTVVFANTDSLALVELKQRVVLHSIGRIERGYYGITGRTI